MESKNYSEALKDPRWQKLRLQVLERDEWACTQCGDNESTLNVHHYRYVKGKQPWEYNIDELTTLCEECHGIEWHDRPLMEKELLEALKHQHFLSEDVLKLSVGFGNLAMIRYPPEVIACMISEMLQNETMMSRIAEWYFAECKRLVEAGQTWSTQRLTKVADK